MISDVHIGYEKSNREDFLRFLDELKEEKIDQFVLVGDIFDFWRRNSIKAIVENQDIIAKFGELNADKINYVIGNHDYYILEWYRKYIDSYPFSVSKNLRLTENGNNFYFTHGYEMEILVNYDLNLDTYEKFASDMCWNSDERGSFLSKVWDTFRSISKEEVDELKVKPSKRKDMENLHAFATSPAKYMFSGLYGDETLIFGHTHMPLIEKKNKIANTGSWVNEFSEKLQNSYIQIVDGEMELKFFK